MSRFKSNDIVYPQGVIRNLEEFLQETRIMVERRDYDGVVDRVCVMQDQAAATGDNELMVIVGELMNSINRPLPYASQTGGSLPLVAVSPNNRPNNSENKESPEYKRNRQPHKIRLKKDMKIKSMMNQFIHLTWKSGWYENEEGGNITMYDVNYQYGCLVCEDFNKESGNLSSLYKGGNYKGLKEEISKIMQTQQDLIDEIERWTNRIHEERES